MNLQYDYELLDNNILVNRAAGGDVDLSEGVTIKIEGKKYIHIGDYRPNNYDQRRAIWAAIMGM